MMATSMKLIPPQTTTKVLESPSDPLANIFYIYCCAKVRSEASMMVAASFSETPISVKSFVLTPSKLLTVSKPYSVKVSA